MGTIKAIFFDLDGVIIDTERDGHRVSFNKTFREFGYSFEWSVDEYHQLLQKVSGGKERLKLYLHTRGFGVEVRPAEEQELIKALHRAKTNSFIAMLDGRQLPLRAGVHRFMQEANALGVRLAVCTTAEVRAADAVAHKILHDIQFAVVLAGDMVNKKKPDPEIYKLALEKTGLKPGEVVVIEDSRNGVLAAKAAGMRVIATTNGYTEKEDLSAADVILTSLGDPDGEKGQLTKGDARLGFDGVLTVQQVLNYFG